MQDAAAISYNELKANTRELYSVESDPVALTCTEVWVVVEVVVLFADLMRPDQALSGGRAAGLITLDVM